MMFNPTVTMPATTGALGAFNAGAVCRNQMFAAWLEDVLVKAQAEGIGVSVDYIPGGMNPFFTLPDSAWIIAEGFNLYCPQAIMTCVDDPLAWIRTQIKMQQAFGRVER